MKIFFVTRISGNASIIFFALIFDDPVKQRPTGKKEWRTGIKKFEYFKNEKSFSGKIKIIVIVFEELSFGEQIKNGARKL